MAVLNFTPIVPDRGPDPFSGIVDSFIKGRQAAQENALNKLKMQYAPQLMQQELKKNALNNLLTQAQTREIDAETRFMPEKMNLLTQNALNAQNRYTPMLTRLENERQKATASGNQDLVNTYDLAIQKNTTDAQARQKSRVATNLEKTLDQIDETALTKYAGIKGKEMAAQEALKVAHAQAPSPDYQAYLNAIHEQIPLLADQVRQFYGTSIQPEQIAELKRMANPNEWLNNPGVSLNLYKTYKKLLESEGQTYRDSLKSTAVYQRKDTQSNSASKKNDTDPLGIL